MIGAEDILATVMLDSCRKLTLTSRSSCFSAKDIKATVNFGTLGVDTCLWNSGTSVAALNI